MARWNDMNQMQHARLQPEVNSFTFQSSSVSYGGANGAFYTTSATRRSGTDGVSVTYCWINYFHIYLIWPLCSHSYAFYLYNVVVI